MDPNRYRVLRRLCVTSCDWYTISMTRGKKPSKNQTKTKQKNQYQLPQTHVHLAYGNMAVPLLKQETRRKGCFVKMMLNLGGCWIWGSWGKAKSNTFQQESGKRFPKFRRTIQIWFVEQSTEPSKPGSGWNHPGRMLGKAQSGSPNNKHFGTDCTG